MKLVQAWHNDHKVGEPQKTAEEALELLEKHLEGLLRGEECES